MFNTSQTRCDILDNLDNLIDSKFSEVLHHTRRMVRLWLLYITLWKILEIENLKIKIITITIVITNIENKSTSS